MHDSTRTDESICPTAGSYYIRAIINEKSHTLESLLAQIMALHFSFFVCKTGLVSTPLQIWCEH